jgi:hypothetical protein
MEKIGVDEPRNCDGTSFMNAQSNYPLSLEINPNQEDVQILGHAIGNKY